MGKRGLFPTLAVLLLAAGGAGGAAESTRPDGAVILTVGGKVAAANRAPYDPAVDAFFGYHEQAFDDAFEFSLGMLEGLGVTEAHIEYKDWNGPIAFSGPRLADVLRSAGCGGGPIATLALDGFTTEIPAAEVDARDWILSTRADGRPHAIGGRGPLWLVFDPPGDRPATEDEELMWPWALFFIRCG